MEKKEIYEKRLARLRELKIEETKKKLAEVGYTDEDDYNNPASPPGYDWQPPVVEEDGEFYGYSGWAENFADMVASFPPVVIPESPVCGNFYRILTRFRTRREGADWGIDHLYPVFEKYGILPGLGSENHFCGDIRIGLELGWGGLLEKVRRFAAINSDSEEKREFYAAEEKFLLSVIGWIEATSRGIAEKLAAEKDGGLRENLAEMLAVNEAVTYGPPRTLREACQFFSWYNLAGRCYNRDGAGGQLDELLRPYYERDIAAGLIDDDDAVYYLAGVLLSDTKYYQLGGPDENGRDMTSRVSWLILEAADILNVTANLTIRVHDGLPRDFFDHAVELLFRHKNGWPRFSGDDSLTAGALKSGLSAEFARRRIAVGCHWMSTPGVEYTRNDTIKINLARVFEVAWQEMMGGEEYSTALLWELYKKHLRAAMDAVIESNDAHLGHQWSNAPELFLNLFCYGPVEKGDDASHRTLDYYNIGVDGAGIAVAADSFAALSSRVEREGKLTWEQVAEAVATDYNCADGKYIQALLKSADKFGQYGSLGGEWAQRIAREFTELVSGSKAKKESYVKFIPGLFSWSQTILLGKQVGATPDGRRAFAPINHGANPFPGSVKSGDMTTLSEAIASVQCERGNTCPFQMELDPKVGAGAGANKVRALLETHLKHGGTLINVNIIDADRILEANEHPELFPDLVVRVTGFTAYFISLSPEFRQLVVDRIVRAS